METVVLLSLTSDIGAYLARHYVERGFLVVGTHRGELPHDLAQNPSVRALRCDLADPLSGERLAAFLEEQQLRWTRFVSCVGQLSPVGRFFDTKFSEWSASVEVNSVAQLRALHAVYPLRQAGRTNAVVFFAGGGTNGPFTHYSAYCVGKLALIKMCELLDDEAPDLNTFIVGTGWVRTKIHEQTLAAGAAAGRNYDTTRAFLADGQKGTSLEDVAAMIEWGVERGRGVAGGRNFSVVHDAWRSGGENLAAALRADTHKFKLRRSGNQS